MFLLNSAPFAHPIETIKAKLQLQFSMDAIKAADPPTASSPISATQTSPRPQTLLYRERYTGPIDVTKQTVKVQGLKGMWKGYGATLWFRSSFAVSRTT